MMQNAVWLCFIAQNPVGSHFVANVFCKNMIAAFLMPPNCFSSLFSKCQLIKYCERFKKTQPSVSEIQSCDIALQMYAQISGLKCHVEVTEKWIESKKSFLYSEQLLHVDLTVQCQYVQYYIFWGQFAFVLDILEDIICPLTDRDTMIGFRTQEGNLCYRQQ